MNTLNRKVTFVVVIVAFAIFALLPWVSFDGDISGIYWSFEDASAGKNAHSMSGLNLILQDSFAGTQKPLLILMIICLGLVLLSLVESKLIKSYQVFDPYVRFGIGFMLVLLTLYVNFVLLTGEVGAESTVNLTVRSDNGNKVVFVTPQTGKAFYLSTPENGNTFIGQDFYFASHDFMNINIGSVGMLIASGFILGFGQMPTRQHIQKARLSFRMWKMNDEERIQEAHRIWEETPNHARRNTIINLLGPFKAYSEITSLLDEWSTEAKTTV